MDPDTSDPPAPLFDWLSERRAGVLLHPTCLPGRQGVGTFGRDVLRFLDFLQAAGMRYWQVCPLGPTGYGDSPYQCFSAFAGNPYLIDLDELADRGLLGREEAASLCVGAVDRVDFGALYRQKLPLLLRAYEAFRRGGRPSWNGAETFSEFQARQAHWLDAYALYQALKERHGGRPWHEWPEESRRFETASRSSAPRDLGPAIEAQKFYQYVFFSQLRRVRAEAARRGLALIGDIPIFAAADSADVWANPGLFELDQGSGRQLAGAGVPPDYFSADGQLWGNPLYAWDRHRADGYAWWKARLRASFELYDVVRIDHFRGLESYWRVPLPAANARNGRWMPGPGLDFFRAIRAEFPSGRIIAEDLGILTPDVLRLRAATGLPGMAVLQFAFGGGPDNLYLPHNVSANSVIYTGTHDNDTSLGWYATAGEPARDHVRRYFRVNGAEIGWDLIRAAYASVSRLAVIPLQDVLGLGSSARFNTPGRPDGNWQWRARPDEIERLLQGTAAYLRELGSLYGRLPLKEKPAS